MEPQSMLKTEAHNPQKAIILHILGFRVSGFRCNPRPIPTTKVASGTIVTERLGLHGLAPRGLLLFGASKGFGLRGVGR